MGKGVKRRQQRRPCKLLASFYSLNTGPGAYWARDDKNLHDLVTFKAEPVSGTRISFPR